MKSTRDTTKRTDQRAYQFADGSEIEFVVRRADPTITRIFASDVAKRMRRVRRVAIENDATLVAFRSFVPAAGTSDHQSTTTHSLPDGEVSVSIDATGRGIHGYLYHLVTAAVAYTHSVNLEAGRIALLSVALLGPAIALVSAGQWMVSLPLFGAGGTIGLHLVVYVLSAHGFTMSRSRVPDPLGPSMQ